MGREETRAFYGLGAPAWSSLTSSSITVTYKSFVSPRFLEKGREGKGELTCRKVKEKRIMKRKKKREREREEWVLPKCLEAASDWKASLALKSLQKPWNFSAFIRLGSVTGTNS